MFTSNLWPNFCCQEPYFKTRAAQRGRPGDAAELLQLRRKAAAMSADFAKLLGTHERTEAAVVDLRQKAGAGAHGWELGAAPGHCVLALLAPVWPRSSAVYVHFSFMGRPDRTGYPPHLIFLSQVRQLREELGAKDKALELARRTIERLSGEKAGLESAAAGAGLWLYSSRALSVGWAGGTAARASRLQTLQLAQTAQSRMHTRAVPAAPRRHPGICAQAGGTPALSAACR